MGKQGCCLLVVILSLALLTGCVGSLWTGASLVYDRHNIYKTVNDYQLQSQVSTALNRDQQLKCDMCYVDVAVFRGDILIAGHVPSQELLDEINEQLSHVKGQRRLFNQLRLMTSAPSSRFDSWITTKIRSRILLDDRIDPKAFKVVTVDRVVYLMGDVDPKQADLVIGISRHAAGVEHVVKMMKYFTYIPKGTGYK